MRDGGVSDLVFGGTVAKALMTVGGHAETIAPSSLSPMLVEDSVFFFFFFLMAAGKSIMEKGWYQGRI